MQRTLYGKCKPTLHFAKLAEEMGLNPEVVSIGSTPPFHAEIRDTKRSY